MIRILIVDDQKSIREKLKTALEQEPNLEVVGTAEDGYTAIKQVRNLSPDIVIMDMIVPGIDGLSATQIICRDFPQTKLIGWSTFDSKDLVGKFFRAGGKGYLLKDTPMEELAAAIALVAKGYVQISPSLITKSEKNISKVIELTTVAATTPAESQAPIVQKANSRNGKVDELQDVVVASQNNSIKALDLDSHAPSSSLAIERQINQETLVPIEANELLPSVSKWTILGGLVTASAIALTTVMAMFIQYKVVVKGDAKVRPAGELRLVQAATDGTITDIAAKLNQVVAKGDIIATLDSSQLQTQASQLQTSMQQAQLQLIQIQAQINALKSQIQAETDKIKRDLAAARVEYSRRLREYQDRQVITVAEVEEAQANLKLAQDELTRYQQLVNSGAIAQIQLTEKQAAYDTAQARLKRVQTALNPSDAQVAISTETIAQLQATGRATLATLNKERQALIQQKIEVNKLLERDRSALQQLEKDLETTKIKATVDGIIAQLNIRNPGQTVRAGEEIAQIVPSNSAMELKARITPQDISKVKLEQPVDLRVSACPYPDYGTLKGVVSKISPDALSVQNSNNPLSLVAPQQTFYEVTIAPNNVVLTQGNKRCPLQLGMESRAYIITKQETVWQFMLRKARLTTNL